MPCRCQADERFLWLQVEPDLSNFDDSMAWPLLLDNFVEWSQQQKQQ